MITLPQTGLLILLSLFLVFHVIILLKIIPYNLIWGGRLKSDKEMYRFEIFSIIFNAIFLIVILIHANIISIEIPKKIITYALWVMAILFCLNTVGNAVSKNLIERSVFTPVTILLAIFSIILALTN